MLARAALTATALLAFAQNPGAHGNIKEPKATFTNGAPIVQWVMIDNFWVIGIGGDQVGKFKTMAKEKGMGFNDVVLDMVKDKKWGYTSTDVDSQPVPSDGKVKWLANGGGACELYIDDKMVPHGDDSEEEFPGGLDALSVTALLAFAPEADAHGNLKEPKATFQDGAPTVEWVTMIDNFWDIGSGGDQVGKFKTMAKEKGMSVKDVVLDMVKDKKCGYTRTDVDPQPVPSDGKVKWLGNGGGGFTHTGPCELYLDDKMVLHGDDCEEEFPGGADGSNKMSEMPVDFASCNGKCMLTIYWLAFQNEQWQAYVNCVPVQGSGSATQTQSSAAGPSTEEQTPAAPSTSTDPEAPTTQTTPAPAADNPSEKTPSTETKTTEAPSLETQDTKCNAPARRLRKKISTV
ncbi:hypothetical protein GQ600_17992 [Phytophthora cactorum]|nr:hypothetical protein GQ600_17992 [Phytophthora cactorum]